MFVFIGGVEDGRENRRGSWVGEGTEVVAPERLG
jgi:hypothetical protein